MKEYKILIINGPNLKLLGKRETSIYGDISLDELENILNKEKDIINKDKKINLKLEFYQSDVEGEIVSKIGENFMKLSGIIINPAGYTHTSVAIHDAIKAVNIPCVEVHISAIYKREEFRHTSIISSACIGQISGFGMDSYALALNALIRKLL